MADWTSPYRQPSTRPPPFRVRAYNDRLFQSLLDDGKPNSPSGSYSRPSYPSKQNRPESRINAGAAARKKRQEDQYRLQLVQQQLAQSRLLRDSLLEAAAKKEREFVRLSGEVAEGHEFVNELDRVLGIAEEAERSKTVKQFQEWDGNVHGEIQRRIDEALASMDSKDINERRRADLANFLATTNAKAAVFRDIIIEAEYDPLEPNRRAIKARVLHLRDPCRRVLDKRAEENGLLSDEGSRTSLALLRETFDVELWEERKVKDTPHGFFAKMMDREASKASKVGKVSRTYQTNFKMDDYVVHRGKDIVTKEFPKGKKTFQAGDEFAPPSSESKSLIGMG